MSWINCKACAMEIEHQTELPASFHAESCPLRYIDLPSVRDRLTPEEARRGIEKLKPKVLN